MTRAYRLLDVFTERPLAGNPLAVVLDASDLTTADMQAIAAEFNLSETVFVLPAGAGVRAGLRIFTPSRELPFAGHPTVGAAVCLALLEQNPQAADGMQFVLEAPAGRIRCRARAEGSARGYASFTLPLLPARVAAAVDPGLAAETLGVGAAEVGFAGHGVGVWSAGVPFLLVPLKTRVAVAGAAVVGALWPRLQAQAGTHGVFVYSRECLDPAHQFHARMFAPGLGIAEDPATGAAVASLAGQIVAADRPADGRHSVIVEQGYEMNRPSLIALDLVVEGGRLREASLGGHAVLVGEGRLYL
jgi:trans-2,3-dihydro-3-hydroxyanthranilate isomerase